MAQPGVSSAPRTRAVGGPSTMAIYQSVRCPLHTQSSVLMRAPATARASRREPRAEPERREPSPLCPRSPSRDRPGIVPGDPGMKVRFFFFARREAFMAPFIPVVARPTHRVAPHRRLAWGSRVGPVLSFTRSGAVRESQHQNAVDAAPAAPHDPSWLGGFSCDQHGPSRAIQNHHGP